MTKLTASRWWIRLWLLVIPLAILVFTFFYYRKINNSESRSYQIELSSPDPDLEFQRVTVTFGYFGSVKIGLRVLPGEEGYVDVLTNDMLMRLGYPEAYVRGVPDPDNPSAVVNRDRIPLNGGYEDIELHYFAPSTNDGSAIINNYYWFGVRGMAHSYSYSSEEIDYPYVVSYPGIRELVIKFEDFYQADISNIYPQPDAYAGSAMIYRKKETISAVLQGGIGIFGRDFVQDNKNESIIFFLGIVIGAMLSIITTFLLDGYMRRK